MADTREKWDARATVHAADVAGRKWEIVERATSQLQAEGPKSWRSRYSTADLSGATRAAAKTARAEGKPALVVHLNRYGCGSWNVEACGSTTFAGSMSIAKVERSTVFMVAPDATVSRIVWEA